MIKNNCSATSASLMSCNTDIKVYLEYWLENNFAQRVENTTLNLAKYVIKDIILPCIKYPMTLKNVNVDYINMLLSEAAKHSDSSGNKVRELLNIAFSDAVSEGILQHNVVKNAKKYPRKNPSVTVMRKEEVKVFLEAAKAGKWYLEIMLALFLGLRKGEIYGLKFSDFSIEDRTVSIERQVTANPVVIKNGDVYSYNVVEKGLKTKNSYRTLRVPPIIIEELLVRKSYRDTLSNNLKEDYYDNDYVSCQRNGLPHAMSALNMAISRLCDAHSLPHISVHSLRHQYATILLEKGVSIAVISALLGHSSVNTTFEFYCDIMDEDKNILDYMNNTFKRGNKRDDTDEIE